METYTDFSFCSTYLLPGESIVWKGRPEKGHILTSADIIMIPFSIFWLGFALFWEFGVIESGIPFFALFGLPFIGVGIYFVFGRFIHKAYLRARTFYVVTNKKLIIKKGNRINIYTPHDLPPMTLQMHKNGNGSIYFTNMVHYRSGRHYTNHIALENLKDVVYAQHAISAMER